NGPAGLTGLGPGTSVMRRFPSFPPCGGRWQAEPDGWGVCPPAPGGHTPSRSAAAEPAPPSEPLRGPLSPAGGEGTSESSSSEEPCHSVTERDRHLLAGGAAFELDHAVGQALGPDGQLPRHADQVGGGEFAARAFVGVVVEDILA